MSNMCPSSCFPELQTHPDAFVNTFDFGVDARTGFMPPEPPLGRLPIEWEPWEAALDKGMSMKLQLAVKRDLRPDEMAQSASWRQIVRDMPSLSTRHLATSTAMLRRAHHVLTFVMHMYIHTLPLGAEIRIPASVSIPLLEVSGCLDIPPIATYSDTVLYNWGLHAPTRADPLALDNLRTRDLFTGTTDEQEFYLASARIEIRGADALALMRATLATTTTDTAPDGPRIAGHLHALAAVVGDLTRLLLEVRRGCDPDIFYHAVRPWFRGEDADPMGRTWRFEGLDAHPEIARQTDLSGPSAGQSALMHALDVFLGLDVGEYAHKRAPDRRTLLRRMQTYMPREHRAFLRHLAGHPRPVRSMAMMGGDPALVAAYNDAVRAVKELRDGHLRIVAQYIIGPASRERMMIKEPEEAGLGSVPLKGTGGTHLVQFLKGVRDKTAEAAINVEPK